MTDAEERRAKRRRYQLVFDDLAAEITDPAVTRAVMFGSNGLKQSGRFFAFVGGDGELITKVPAERAAAVVADGLGAPVKIGRNPAREWVAVPLSSPDEAPTWRSLLAEALEYASGSDAHRA